MLRMKRRFLRLPICDYHHKPLNRDRIANRQEHPLVVLNPFVVFGALVAHLRAALRRGWWLYIRRTEGLLHPKPNLNNSGP